MNADPKRKSDRGPYHPDERARRHQEEALDDALTGDVVVRFDGRDIKNMHDLPRIVADTPVGKEVEVVVIRRGNEETHKVKIDRLRASCGRWRKNTRPKPPNSTVAGCLISATRLRNRGVSLA
jgi:hypothetical protein